MVNRTTTLRDQTPKTRLQIVETHVTTSSRLIGNYALRANGQFRQWRRCPFRRFAVLRTYRIVTVRNSTVAASAQRHLTDACSRPNRFNANVRSGSKADITTPTAECPLLGNLLGLEMSAVGAKQPLPRFLLFRSHGDPAGVALARQSLNIMWDEMWGGLAVKPRR